MSTSNNTKVSVIVPVYNAAETLERSISSLLNQTLQEIEIIIVNDGSTDSSASIINKLVESSEKVISIHFVSNQGVHEARKAGLRKANAPWIGFLDADDIARPSMYETLHFNAETQDVDIAICGTYRVSTERRPLYPETLFKQDQKFNNLLLKRYTQHKFGFVSLCNKLYKKEIILDIYDIIHPWRQDIHEDCLVNFGYFIRASSAYVIKEYLHEYTLNTESHTSTTRQTDKFVGIYRAYAIAVDIYHNNGPEILKDITEMLRVQLDSMHLSIDKLSDLDNLNIKIIEAVNLVHARYPAGLALITARPIRVSSSSLRECSMHILRTTSKKIFGDSEFYRYINSLVKTWRARRLSFNRIKP
jgi:glycosyltransferase involved in cell wall biosynthesis